jgi:hypothetical protein
MAADLLLQAQPKRPQRRLRNRQRAFILAAVLLAALATYWLA